MKIFADKLNEAIISNRSFIVAGFDPILESFPAFLLEDARKQSASQADAVKNILVNFHKAAISAIHGKVAAIKINTAFFEQYGLPGIEALQNISKLTNEAGILLIADAKRGDIGSTAKAYSSAFLGKATAFSSDFNLINADALTVNPFLGFDTLEPFLNDCLTQGKGLFVLVKTSNPGSGDLQNLKIDGRSISDIVAKWIFDKGEKLQGKCGYSGLGAVVGATYPQEAVHLREIMKNNFFLIPGYGAQGGTAKEALAGFATQGGSLGGAIINVSRGLLANFPTSLNSLDDIKELIAERIDTFNKDINSNLP